MRPDTVARSLAIGNPADGDAAIEAVRRSDGAIHAVAEDAIGENMLLLASTTGVFGETAAGVTLGACAPRSRTATSGRATGSCCS